MFKSLLFLFLFLLINPPLQSQEEDFKGYVKYSLGYAPKDKTTDNDPFERQKKDVVRSMSDIEAELFFNSTRSNYRVKRNLDLEGDMSYRVARIIAGNVWYKDTEAKSRIESLQLMGEKMNVIRQYDNFDWEITDETKEIGNFLAYKAKTTFTTENNFTNELDKFEITAWFCPQIPAPFGPKGIDGLPGLVLEVNLGSSWLYATEVNLSSDFEDSILSPPKKGISLSEEKFNALRKERYSKNRY